MNIQFFISFFSYVSVLITIGWVINRKQKNATDFAIGDRSLNYWVTAIATHATDMSAWLFMAFPGLIFSNGLVVCWDAIGLLIFMFLSWQFLAKKFRIDTEKYKSETLSSYFEKRFNDKSGLLRIISAVITLIFFTFYISAGIVALGRALSATFEFSYFTGIVLGTLTVSLYTILGGFLAVAWNDFFQGVFVIFVILGVPLYALFHVGGFSAITQAANMNSVSLSLLPTSISFSSISMIVISALGWGLPYFGQPHILINFMGIDNPENIKKAKRVGMTWQIVALSFSTLIGLVGIAFFKNGLPNNELVFINLVKNLSTPMIAGLLLCAIIAAAVSTMDSQILVYASTLSEDIYKRIFNKKISNKKQLTVSRISGLLITLFSFSLAFNNTESIYGLVRYAWQGLGCAFGPLVIFSLYSKAANKYGALAGVISGSLIAMFWEKLPTSIPEHPIIPGFIVGALSIVLVSWLTRNKK